MSRPGCGPRRASRAVSISTGERDAVGAHAAGRSRSRRCRAGRCRARRRRRGWPWPSRSRPRRVAATSASSPSSVRPRRSSSASRASSSTTSTRMRRNVLPADADTRDVPRVSSPHGRRRFEPTADDERLAGRRAAGHAGRRARGARRSRRRRPRGAAGGSPRTSWTSTTCTCRRRAHICAVCVPAVLAAGGGAREYLAAAGVMARLGTALGLGALRARLARDVHGGRACGRGCGRRARARGAGRATRVRDGDGASPSPAAGGVQRAFGTDAKALQVGFAVEAGAARGRARRRGRDAPTRRASTPGSRCSAATRARLHSTARPIPGGLAVKLYPCCYALQRPIERARWRYADPTARPIRVRTPESSGPAADPRPPAHRPGGRSSRSSTRSPPRCSTARRASTRSRTRRVAGREAAGAHRAHRRRAHARRRRPARRRGRDQRRPHRYPLGSPQRPAAPEDLDAKLAMCGATDLAGVTWGAARAICEAV